MLSRRTVLIGAGGTALAAASQHTALAQARLLAVNDIEKDSVKGRSFELLKKLVSEKTGGKLTLEVSHGQALYDQKSLTQALQLGAVQMSAPGVGVLTGTFPNLSALSLPYLLPSPAAIREAVDDPQVGGVLFAEMRKKGIEPLGVWLNGPRDIGTNGTPILMPEDVKGVKIRVAPGSIYVDTFKQLGANVNTMSWGDVPTALRTGIIDAVEPTPNAWVSSRLYDIAKQISKTGYIWDFYILIGNKSWWDGMAKPTREVFTKSIEESTRWNWENVNEENEKAFATMKAAGATVHDLSPEQLRAWAAAVRPMWDGLGVSLVGADMMKRIIAIGDKHRG